MMMESSDQGSVDQENDHNIVTTTNQHATKTDDKPTIDDKKTKNDSVTNEKDEPIANKEINVTNTNDASDDKLANEKELVDMGSEILADTLKNIKLNESEKHKDQVISMVNGKIVLFGERTCNSS